ncbi:MAG: hypothetical protein EOP04_02785 [Proteobacteria bacterium]|nr:MAG: hypothetical protein EOP04_02785 [Pseudomonadota bacterium]
MFKGLSEDEIVSVLGHELAQYYIGHSMARPGDYNYFYDASSVKAEKPEAVSKNSAIFSAGTILLNRHDFYNEPVAGQIYNYVVTNAVAYAGQSSSIAANEYTNPESCYLKCGQIFSFLTTWDTVNAIVAPTDSSAKLTYLSFQESIKTFYQQLPAARLSADLNHYILQVVGWGFGPLTPQPNENGYDFLRRTDAALTDYESTNSSLLSAAQSVFAEANAGFYTLEQEADEISAEILKRLGIDPSAGISYNIKVLATYNPAAAEECTAQWSQGFPVAIAVGDISLSHHDSCYRAYNIYREIETHATALAEFDKVPRMTFPSDMSWESLTTPILAVETGPLINRGL